MNTNFFGVPSNMERVCRICLTETTNLSSIFCTEQEVEQFYSLSRKIEICGGIELQERDGLPSLICELCIDKASVAHEFRQQCQNSDARLRLYYDKPPKANSIATSTQTESLFRIIVQKKMDTQENYFVKQEIQNINQDLSNSIDSVVFHQQNEAIEENIIATEEKIFLCEIGFDGGKEVQKNSVILETHDPEISQQNSQVLLTTQNEYDQRLQEVVENSTICVPKETENAVFLNEHLLEASENVLQEEREDDDDDDDERMDAEEGIGDGDDDNIETEIFEHEIEEKVILTDEIPKRPTRKAKPGKSYVVEGALDDYRDLGDDSQDDDDDDDDEEKFKCKVCQKSYATLKGLKNHSQVHDKKHKCSTCCRLFYKLENLEKHEKIHETKPHACQLCHTSFTKPQSLARHLKTHSEKSKGLVKSEIDRKDLKTERDSDDDDDHTNEPDEFDGAPGLFKCNVCSQFCSSLKNLKRHSLVHGEKKYSCTVCKKWFFRPDTLKKHAEKHGHGLLDNLVDENKLFESDDEAFPPRTSNNSMMNNTETKKRDDSDEDGTGEYKCQHCDKIMATKKGLRRHVSMHKPKAEPVTCGICKKVCASQARLVLHQKTHNKPKEKVPREYLCHICSKVYPSNSSLTYHMRTHTGIKPHVCKTCNSGFTTTTSLANHIRIHTGDKPFVCHVCSAAFAVSSAFRRHLTRHTGEANYLCKTCGKAFKRLSTLKEHTYTHSGEKPYVCKTCGAAYSHSGSLFAHQKRCRAQYGELVNEEHINHNHVNITHHHIHVNNVQSAVRSLAVIGQIF